MDREELTIPGFIVSIIAGITTIFLTGLVHIIALNLLNTWLGVALRDMVVVLLTAVILMHYSCGVLMIVSSFLIKHEDHSLAGSILILIVSTICFVSFGGMFIGPILGFAGGVVGLKEHQKLMRTPVF